MIALAPLPVERVNIAQYPSAVGVLATWQYWRILILLERQCLITIWSSASVIVAYDLKINKRGTFKGIPFQRPAFDVSSRPQHFRPRCDR